ncbi:MAG: di-heme-cytochrome C peroxidase [Chloroflexia bacterium]
MSKRWKWLIGVFIGLPLLLAVSFGVFFNYLVKHPDLPDPIQFKEVVETNLVWTADDRQMFYHTSQGSEVMPMDWFMALEQANNTDRFMTNEYMSRFRFVPDISDLRNPYKIPIGFAKDDPDPVTGVQNLGLSCALCHTAMVTYNGKGIRIDGAPGNFNFDTFLEQIIFAVGITAAPEPYQVLVAPGKFDRFAKRVLGEKYNADTSSALRSEVRTWLKEKVADRLQDVWKSLRSGEKPTLGGYGRLDALGTGGNTMYRKIGTQNISVLNAPVKAFPLWYASDYDWVQSNGSVRQPMARNIIEAQAVNAYLALPGKSIEERYSSSVRLRQMYEMETTMARLEAPAWPAQVFGAVDAAKAERGKALYGQLCANCHAPKIEPAPLCGDDVAIRNKKRYFILRLFNSDQIGTDTLDARNFMNRRLDATKLGMSADTPGPVVIQMVVGGVMRRGFDQMGLTLAQRDEMAGYRADCWRAVDAYPARPLDGVWASSPFLHNGSVPNVYQLLLPYEKRDKVFYTGNTEYDPKHMGYLSKQIAGSFKVDTDITGNSNRGHEFRNAPAGTKGVLGRELTDSQRWDLIEYLKIISEVPAAKKAAAEEPESSWANRCWTDPYWGSCKAAPLDAKPGTLP